jgi:hypothetical protein
MQSIILDDKW